MAENPYAQFGYEETPAAPVGNPQPLVQRAPPAPPAPNPGPGYVMTGPTTAAPITGGSADPANRPPSVPTANELASLRGRYGGLTGFERTLGELEDLYQQNLQGEQGRILGIEGGRNPRAYLPFAPEGYATFDATAGRIIDQIIQAFDITGGEANSVAELRARFGPYLPNSTDNDQTIEAKLNALRGILEDQRRILSDELQRSGQSLPASPRRPERVDQSSQVIGTPRAPQTELSSGDVQADTNRQTINSQAQQRLSQMLKSGASDAEIRAYGAPLGIDVEGALQFRRTPQWREWRRQNPNAAYPFRDDANNLPMGGLSGAIAGAAASPVGTFITNAGNAAMAGTLPLIADAVGDGEQFRLGMAAQREANPGSALAGNVAGGLTAYGVGGRVLGNVGSNLLSNPTARAVAGDVLYGGLQGLGENHDPLSGAVESVLGGLGGRLATRGLASTVSPTGGDVAGLYAQGVRPSIGQRFRDTNSIGEAVNLIEEGSQSFPIVGALPRATRQRARDQWERGAWDQALGNLTDRNGNPIRLGANTVLGPAAHREAQQAFDDAYANVRSRLTFQADQDWASDLAQIRADADLLADPVRRRFNNILRDAIENRLGSRGGVLNGEAFKAAASDLGSEIRRIRNLRNPTESQRELLGTLEELDSALHQGARRASPPEVVSELDRIDRGYAMLTRIENASIRRMGNGIGRFTPSDILQVEARSGGARGRRFSAGDGLFTDYADQGRRLEDVLPSSGTSERQQIMGTLATLGTAGAGAGGAYMLGADPSTIGGVAAIPLLFNAPGARQGITGAMAPRGQLAALIAERMRAFAPYTGNLGSVAASYGIDR